MRILKSLLFAIALAFPGAVLAQGADIQRVINGQIQSFLKDDFATAFTFAAPNIRGMFRTPENFGRMVTRGYPMVYRPSEVEFQDIEPRGAEILQRVRLRDTKGQYFMAEYTMVLIGTEWKIAGVSILREPGVGV
ncbi:MAG: DUF4864 domain-containing protein [Pseudomonadota bacterium]